MRDNAKSRRQYTKRHIGMYVCVCVCVYLPSTDYPIGAKEYLNANLSSSSSLLFILLSIVIFITDVYY